MSGYTLAFALGVVCTGVLFWVMSPDADTQIRGTETGPAAPVGAKEDAHAAHQDHPEAAAAEPVVRDQPEGGGTRVAGRVVLRGVPPPEQRLPLDERCAAKHAKPPTTRFFAVAPDGGLADVVVFISDGLPARQWPRPGQPLVLRIKGCLYEPYVSAVRAEQPIHIMSGDEVLHNALIVPGAAGNTSRNLAILPELKLAKFTLGAPELFARISCDVHPWEHHYLSAFDHPFFAVTNERGEFQLPRLPKGRYTIEAHHRKCGVLRRHIEVGAKEEQIELFFEVP